MQKDMFDLSKLTWEQKLIIEEALSRCSFNWEVLKPKLKSEKNKDLIPVEFIDCNVFGNRSSSSHTDEEGKHEHIDVYHNGDTGHGILFRNKILGLAWYSGKVSIDLSLINSPQLAMETFLAEGAHMIDFFYMTPEHRKKIYEAYHGDDHSEHGHGWFEETGNTDYWSWVGESFMGGFILAYSNVPLSFDGFHHQSAMDVAIKIRGILGDFTKPQYYITGKSSKLFHRILSHTTYKRAVTYTTRQIALSERRPCKVCKA